MSNQNPSHHAVASAEHNRLLARRWIDASNERDDADETSAKETLRKGDR